MGQPSPSSSTCAQANPTRGGGLLPHLLPLPARRWEERAAAGALGAGTEGQRSWEIDGPKRCEHNEVIPPSRGSSIPWLRRGVPTARPRLRFAWAIA